MAQKNYQINQAIKVFYQAAGTGTGLTVTMDVYDEADVKDVAQSGTMTEIGTTGRYQKSFTPDAVGDWHIEISDSAGGEAVKQYEVGSYNIQALGDNIADIDADIAALNDVSTTEINAEVDTALTDYDASTKAELDAAELAIRGADSDTLETLSDQIDSIEASFEAPPMIG